MKRPTRQIHVDDGYKRPARTIMLFGKIDDLRRHVADLKAAGHSVKVKRGVRSDGEPCMAIFDVDGDRVQYRHIGSYCVSIGLAYWKHHGPVFTKEYPRGNK